MLVFQLGSEELWLWIALLSCNLHFVELVTDGSLSAKEAVTRLYNAFLREETLESAWVLCREEREDLLLVSFYAWEHNT